MNRTFTAIGPRRWRYARTRVVPGPVRLPAACRAARDQPADLAAAARARHHDDRRAARGAADRLGWADEHLHRFLIHGREYGIPRDGGVGFGDDARKVRLAGFGLRVGERFVYDYDFIDRWRHDIRVEQLVPSDPGRSYPVCTGGRRAGPPEDCGGAWAFLELRQRYSLPVVAARAAELLGRLIDAAANDDDLDVIAACRSELADLHPWLGIDRFDQRAVNRLLAALSTPAVTPGRVA